MSLNELTIHDMRSRLAAGEVTSVEVLEAVYDRINVVDGTINAYTSLMKESAYEAADRADRDLKDGRLKPLSGVPVAVKDILCTEGTRTSCGSRMLEHFIPPYDATVIRRLKEAGAVFVGKTNMDEFAMGSSNETSYFGVTRNPWDRDRIPGGSSGGSAAAVIADECIAAVGSDTGGSIRQPAAHCGVVGLKPTYGRVSRYGLIAFASSLDQVGPLTKDVEDTAIMMNVLAGHDAADSTSVPRPVPDYSENLSRGIEGWTVGIPREYFIEGIDPEITGAIDGVVRTMESLGAECREISLPHSQYCVAAYYIIAPAEASSNLARYDGVRYGFRSSGGETLLDSYKATRSAGFGAEVKRRIMIGTYSLSAGYYDAYYKKASQVRALIKTDFDDAFRTCDVILTPTTPTPAFRIGEKVDDPLQMYLTDIFTLSINLAGVPALSLPCGYSTAGLPLGAQLIAHHFREDKLIQAAAAVESRLPLEKRRPGI